MPTSQGSACSAQYSMRNDLRQSARRLPEKRGISERPCPHRLLLHHLGGRQHVRRARKNLAPVEVLVALGGAVAALVLEVERAVGGLERIRMHRLVREEQRERLVALARDEFHRVLV